jgi:hypothetical protein
MALPEAARQTLIEVGQIAAELPCAFDDCREFVSVYAAPRDSLINVDGQFTYLDGAPTIFRAIRFRVMSALIEADLDVGPEDLIGLQTIVLPSEDAVEFVMGIWKVPLDKLLSPRNVDIPV